MTINRQIWQLWVYHKLVNIRFCNALFSKKSENRSKEICSIGLKEAIEAVQEGSIDIKNIYIFSIQQNFTTK